MQNTWLLSNGPLHKWSNPKFLDNEKAVKHCSFATAKTPSLNSKGTTQAFKPRASRKIIAHWVTGRVVWFNVNKGYGFIRSDHNDNYIFVQNSDIAKNNPKKLIKSLAQGEVVKFDIAIGIKNMPRAINVTGPNNRAVQVLNMPQIGGQGTISS